MNVQLDGAEPQVERGSQEEGPWRMAPGPMEHLCCDLEEEPQSLQEKGERLEDVCAGNTVQNSLLISVHRVELKIPNCLELDSIINITASSFFLGPGHRNIRSSCILQATQ